MTAIDWSAMPAPWNEIGPRAAEGFAAIVRGETPPPPNLPITDAHIAAAAKIPRERLVAGGRKASAVNAANWARRRAAE
jgi:hypothetical protein